MSISQQQELILSTPVTFERIESSPGKPKPSKKEARFQRLERAIEQAAKQFRVYCKHRPLAKWSGEDLYSMTQRMAPLSDLFFQAASELRKKP